MTPWDPSLWGDDPIDAVLQWHETTDAGRFDHVVSFRPHLETEGQWRVPRTFLPRILCHVIVNRLPDKGLPELCETLGQMFEFYAARQPTVERLTHEEPTNAYVVANEERPAFFVAEEE